MSDTLLFSDLPIESQNRILMNDNVSLFGRMKSLENENAGLYEQLNRVRKRTSAGTGHEIIKLKDTIDIQNRKIARQEKFISNLKEKLKAEFV
ncbi:MAG TPA: hypothetical protein VGN64_06140 [Dyadobacter sp.]|nr:hypothetical protein [Dyadobacter sp.]